MTPTKIILQKTDTHLHLKIFAANGCTVIRSEPRKAGVQTVFAMRKHAAKLAKHLAIPFTDETQDGKTICP